MNSSCQKCVKAGHHSKPSHSPLPPASRLETLVTKFFVEWWLLEILSLCLSIASMTAIVALLLVTNGRPIPVWPLGLTLNGVVSFLSGVAKSALLLPTAESIGQLKWSWFLAPTHSQSEEGKIPIDATRGARPMMDFERIDRATRGPWGAFLLLARMNRMTLPSFGAAIILLAIPFDLFVQKLVDYSLIWVPVNNASIARSINYSPAGGLFYINGSRRIGPIREMVAALEPVFLSNGTVPELDANCPTSRCTWKPFDTLATCSQCVDLSSKLLYGCYETPAEWLSNLTYDKTPYPNVAACGYYLSPDGNSRIFLSGYTIKSDGTPGEALGSRIFPLVDANPSSRQPMFDGTLNFEDVRNPLIDFIVSGTPDGPAGAYRNATPTVHECVLYWCVKSVISVSYGGKIYENTTKTVQLDSPDGYPWKNVTIQGHQLPRYQTNFSLSLPPGTQPDLQNNSFAVYNMTTLQTLLALDQIAPSYVTAPDVSLGAQLRWLNGGQFFGTPPQVIPIPRNTFPWLPPNNITAQVGKIATVMTTVMRNTPIGDELSMVNGTAYEQRTFVKVYWLWVIFPLILLLLGLIFLMATVAKSSKEEGRVSIWKNSSIAVLFNGLGEDVQKSVGPNCRMGEANAKARDLMVKLEIEVTNHEHEMMK